MKAVLIALLLALCAPFKALANPACPVCTVAIAGSLAIARKLGVDDCIVALWAGALLAMIGYWTIRFLDKKGWTFAGYKPIVMALSIAMVGFIYIKDLTYTPNVILGFLYIDYFLFATLLGAALLIFGVHLYAFMKAKNGGHAHFPFEKVVVPIALLALMNVFMVVHPICNCDTKGTPANIVTAAADMTDF